MSRTFALLCLLAIGCNIEPAIKGSGRLTTETRETSTFSAVACDVSCTVEVRKGEKSSVEFSMDDNLLSMIKSEVVDQKLKLTSEKSIAPSDGAKIIITTPTLSLFAAAGDVKANIEELTGDAMTIALAGASSVTGRANGKALEIEIAGAGDVKLSGTASKLTVSIAGSGDVQTTELAADDVQLEIAGSGKVLVQAQKTLDVSVAGSGDVSYVGEATVKQSIAGSGSVKKISVPAPPAGNGSTETPTNENKADTEKKE